MVPREEVLVREKDALVAGEATTARETIGYNPWAVARRDRAGAWHR